MEQTTLAWEIHAVFPADPIAFDDATTGATDDGAYQRHVHGRPWVALDRAFISRRVDTLRFLAPHHVAAVLPAYLTALIMDGAKTHVPDTLLLVLGEADPRIDELRALLTRPQRDAVRAALELFASTQTGPLMEAAHVAARGWT